jgi:hydrogenase maturation protease
METKMTKTIVIGLGNPILGNDGVGWKVAEEVERRIGARADVEVDCVSLGGISLMERLIGYDQAIVVDALQAEPTGSVLVLTLEDLPNYSAFHTTNVHDVSLQNALKMGRDLGAQLPKRVMVVGVAVEPVFDFGEELSPEVQAAVPLATAATLDLLDASNPAETS